MSQAQHLPLDELFTRYLKRRGLADPGFERAPGEVVPFDAAAPQPVDPRLAWDEATAALRCFGRAEALAAVSPPPDWAALVANHEPVLALPFCTGNFPQLLRNLHELLHAAELRSLLPVPGRPTPSTHFMEWSTVAAKRVQFPQALISLGCLRLAKEFDRAAHWLDKLRGRTPPEWQAALANEEAALAWHAGRADEAAALWQAQAESTPVLFNRGVAALFLDRPADARPVLTGAVEQLPEESAWHHLGRLYLALADMRP